MTKAALETSLSSLDTLIQVFGVICAIGLVGEVGFGVRHWSLSKQMQRIEASESLEKQGEIARLNKESVVLGKQVEDEKAERLRLQSIISPRSISIDRQRAVSDALRVKFSGSSLNLVSYSLDPEGAVLSEQIYAVLASAGIRVVDKTATVIPLNGFFGGILVNSRDPKDLMFVKGLYDAFSVIGGLDLAWNIGEVPIRGPVLAGGVDSTESVTLMVGVKPLPAINTAIHNNR